MEGSAMTTLTTALKTGFTTVANDCISAIGDIAPVALPVLGSFVVIGIGIKVFKKVTGR